MEWKEVEKKSDFGAAKEPQILKCINPGDFEITNYTVIPSTATLMQLDASNAQDLRKLKDKRRDIRLRLWNYD